MHQTLTLHNRLHRSLAHQPITTGTAWPSGAVAAADQLAVRDEQGRLVPAGFTCLNRWPDGSVQWALVDCGLDFAPSSERRVTVVAEPAAAAVPPAHPAHGRIEGERAEIGNGLVRIAVSAAAGEFLQAWEAGGRPLVKPAGLEVAFTMDGQRYSLQSGPRQFSLEHLNPLRAVLRVDGRHAAPDGSTGLDYHLRFEVRADRADVKVTYAFRNREPREPGVEVRDFAVTLDTPFAGVRRCFEALHTTRHYWPKFLRVTEDPEIVAADTGEIDSYQEKHERARTGECFVRDAAALHDPPETKPWYLRQANYRQAGIADRVCRPYLALLGAAGGVLASFENMAGLYPKGITAKGSALRLAIYPDWAGPLGITQGAGRSHVFHLAPLAADATDLDIQNAYLSWEMPSGTGGQPWQPIEIIPDIEHLRACRVLQVHKLPAYDPQGRYLFERKVLDAWIGQSYGTLGAVDRVPSPVAKGFWEFGDTGGNNEEMWALPYFQNYLRAGNWDCFEVGLAMADHILEVDYCAFSTDPYQHGGMCAHCANHNDGAAYPSHMWFTELLFAYALTGDAEYRNAALHICENLLHWIHDRDGFLIISMDQREAGQPMINLTWCHEFNRDPRYLEGCRKIIYDYCMASARKHRRLLDEKPKSHPIKLVNYGDYATWEGIYWYWEITRDETVKQFMLEQFEQRLTESASGIYGFHRVTDFNPAAYAYYLTGDRAWLDRVARPLRAAFRSATWRIGWIHAMYALKVAFDQGIITDQDVQG